jgi:hypothetical protein
VIAAHGVDRDNGTGGGQAAARSAVRAAVPGVVGSRIPGVAAAPVGLGVPRAAGTGGVPAPPGR